jgi:hypothetical protein
MSVHFQPLSEITHRAKSALIQELGVVDTLRFLNQFRAGSGDYTAERDQLFKGTSVKSVIAEIKARRGDHYPNE